MRTSASSPCSRRLSGLEARKQLASARDQFEFLPAELIESCRLLIERYHASERCVSPADIVWRSDGQELLQHHCGLRTLFRHACRTRTARLAKERIEILAALILACETLVRGFGGWAVRFPEAKQQAEELFARGLKRQVWLIETYGHPGSSI